MKKYQLSILCINNAGGDDTMASKLRGAGQEIHPAALP